MANFIHFNLNMMKYKRTAFSKNFIINLVRLITELHEGNHERPDGNEKPDENHRQDDVSTSPVHRRASPFAHILEEIDIPNELKKKLPQKWKRLGNAVVLKLPPELLDYREEIGRVYSRNLAVDTIFRSTSSIKDEFRRPSVERIYGTSNEVTSIENGIKYCFDITRIMFSKGNTPERARVCTMNMCGEKVLDMFAGIGYFSLPAAVHGKAREVVAIEKNPIAFGYLKKNIALNHCEGVVHPLLGDNRELKIDTDFDRVFMGYLLKTEDFLSQAASALSEKGGIIHFHTNIERVQYRNLREKEESGLGDLPGKLSSVLGSCLNTYHLCLTSIQLFRVKSYAPSVYHVVFDINCEKT